MVTHVLPNLYDAGVKSRKIPYLAMLGGLRSLVGGGTPDCTDTQFYQLLDHVWKCDTLHVPIYAENLEDRRELDWQMYSFVAAFGAFDEFLKTYQLHDDVMTVLDYYRPYVAKETAVDNIKSKVDVDVNAVVELLSTLNNNKDAFQHATNAAYEQAGSFERINLSLTEFLETERRKWIDAREDAINIILAKEQAIILQEKLISLGREVRRLLNEAVALRGTNETLMEENKYFRRSTASLKTRNSKAGNAE